MCEAQRDLHEARGGAAHLDPVEAGGAGLGGRAGDEARAGATVARVDGEDRAGDRVPGGVQQAAGDRRAAAVADGLVLVRAAGEVRAERAAVGRAAAVERPAVRRRGDVDHVGALLADVAGGVDDADLERALTGRQAGRPDGLVLEVRALVAQPRRAGGAAVGARAGAVVLGPDDGAAAAQVDDLDAADAAVVGGVERDGVGAVAAAAGQQAGRLESTRWERRVVERRRAGPTAACETPPPAAVVQAVLTVPLKQPTAICSVVAPPE